MIGVSNGSVSGVTNVQMTDGTIVICNSPGIQEVSVSNAQSLNLQGIYAPASGSAVTVKLQLAATTGTANINSSSSLDNTVEWTVLRIF